LTFVNFDAIARWNLGKTQNVGGLRSASSWRQQMETRRRVRAALVVGSTAALLSACGGSSPLGATPGGVNEMARQTSGSETFDYTGSEQEFIVPSGVTKIKVVALGAAGAGSDGHSCDSGCFGRGARVSAVIPVTPSETLAIYVGGAGTSSGAGGYNGGGAGAAAYGLNAGSGGGGASDVRESGAALKKRVLVAGGGGGQGYQGSGGGAGGRGGASTGASGKPGCCKHTRNGGGGGTGGTESQGGSGGEGPGAPGQSGRIGYAGTGGSGCPTSCGGYLGGGGGGGGGGYYGGGGGGGGVFYGSAGAGGGGGGGGGSSYAEPRAANVHITSGWKTATGNGLVVISWR
jgi:hypothetical protein